VYNRAAMVTDIGYLLLALVVAGILVWILRRASVKSLANKPQSVRERLGATPEATIGRRRRARPDVATTADGRLAEEVAAEEAARARGEDVEGDDDEADDEAEDEGERPDRPAPSEATTAFRSGLAKTRGTGFVAKLGKLFGKKKIDASILSELEEVLFTADIGPRAADNIFQAVKSSLSKNDLTDSDKVWEEIRKASSKIVDLPAPPLDLDGHKPFVLLVLGVNGVGKTTTIGKLAAKYSRAGKRVLLAAGDTFRAAATEQLEEWGRRSEVPVVKGKPGGDPSSVIFDAIKRGVEEKFDLVICDTAGRLHSNAGLMDELKKIRRVADKAMSGAPHQTWMVLDATTGQNAISQAKTFKADMEITGIVLTKLDGSAKGGVVLAICDELKVPVRFVGVGEKIDDLRPFEVEPFVDALYGDVAR
jgi:fused signal recognition particle receptor